MSGYRTPPHQLVYRKQLDLITKNLQIEEILAKLFACQLISQRDMEKMTRMLDNHGPIRTAEHLIIEVMMKKPSQDSFNKFVAILREADQESMADTLENELEKVLAEQNGNAASLPNKEVVSKPEPRIGAGDGVRRRQRDPAPVVGQSPQVGGQLPQCEHENRQYNASMNTSMQGQTSLSSNRMGAGDGVRLRKRDAAPVVGQSPQAGGQLPQYEHENRQGNTSMNTSMQGQTSLGSHSTPSNHSQGVGYAGGRRTLQPQLSLDEDIDERDLNKLADDIGDEWRTLGIELGIKQKKLQQFRSNHHNMNDVICEMLCHWNDNSPETRREKINILRTALQKSGRYDLVRKKKLFRPDTARQSVQLPVFSPQPPSLTAAQNTQYYSVPPLEPYIASNPQPWHAPLSQPPSYTSDNVTGLPHTPQHNPHQQQQVVHQYHITYNVGAVPQPGNQPGTPLQFTQGPSQQYQPQPTNQSPGPQEGQSDPPGTPPQTPQATLPQQATKTPSPGASGNPPDGGYPYNPVNQPGFTPVSQHNQQRKPPSKEGNGHPMAQPTDQQSSPGTVSLEQRRSSGLEEWGGKSAGAKISESQPLPNVSSCRPQNGDTKKINVMDDEEYNQVNEETEWARVGREKADRRLVKEKVQEKAELEKADKITAAESDDEMLAGSLEGLKLEGTPADKSLSGQKDPAIDGPAGALEVRGNLAQIEGGEERSIFSMGGDSLPSDDGNQSGELNKPITDDTPSGFDLVDNVQQFDQGLDQREEEAVGRSDAEPQGEPHSLKQPPVPTESLHDKHEPSVEPSTDPQGIPQELDSMLSPGSEGAESITTEAVEATTEANNRGVQQQSLPDNRQEPDGEPNIGSQGSARDPASGPSTCSQGADSMTVKAVEETKANNTGVQQQGEEEVAVGGLDVGPQGEPYSLKQPLVPTEMSDMESAQLAGPQSIQRSDKSLDAQSIQLKQIPDGKLDCEDLGNKNCIGQGSFGRVLIGAFDGEKVAVKLIRFPDVHKKLEDKFQSDCEHEIKIMTIVNTLCHPNIVLFKGYQVRENTYCNDEMVKEILIVCELVKGNNLQQILLNKTGKKQYQLNFDNKLKIMKELASALQGLHKMGVTHRDIKPSNILISHPSHVLKLCDLGLAKAKGSVATMTSSRPGSITGTLSYAAPEIVIYGKSPTKASDIYSYGASMLQLLTEKYMWPDTVKDTINDCLKKKTRPKGLAEIEDEDVRELLTACLDYDPQKRHTAQQLVNTLHK